jgi:hyperosmotically inducible periplasmic protein
MFMATKPKGEGVVNLGMLGMSASFLQKSRMMLPLGLLAGCAIIMAATSPRHQNQNSARQTDAKNEVGATSDQQFMNSADRATTQKIRKAIHRDKTLSNKGRNIKILMQRGKVTLQGLVKSEDEKDNLEAKAAGVAGAENVSNQLQIAPSK